MLLRSRESLLRRYLSHCANRKGFRLIRLMSMMALFSSSGAGSYSRCFKESLILTLARIFAQCVARLCCPATQRLCPTLLIPYGCTDIENHKTRFRFLRRHVAAYAAL